MSSKRYPVKFAIGILLFSLGFAASAKAADKKSQPAAEQKGQAQPQKPGSPGGSGAEEVNVEAIKEKYWARGEESEMGVVQNRLYSKEHKIELGLYGGFLTSDPFLSIRALGGTLGYHFNEYLSAHLVVWKPFVGKSAAMQGFQEVVKASSGAPAVPDGNYPHLYYGGEFAASLLYGKLSLVGKAIIYYDMHLLGGIGVTNTDYANLFTPSLGLGQQVYLNKFTAVRLDYRVTYYREHLIKKADPSDTAPPPDIGRATADSRANWTHVLTLGVNFLFGLGGK